MIELPEAITIGRQVEQKLAGRTVTDVYGATHLHKFTFFNDTPEAYKKLLVGRRVESAEGKGIFVDIRFDDNVFLSIFDGIKMRYNESTTAIPKKYQMLITFDDDSFISFNTTMYGGIYVFKGSLDNKYRTLSMDSISPLSSKFNESYFEKLISSEKKNITAKALLATEQRIPGVGNGVLQDILFNASIHPKRKILSFTEEEKQRLFRSLKTTLQQMTGNGGRDTETDFFGNKGGYKSILSKNTYDLPCPKCGSTIVKEAYMGGSVYYCPECQKL
ncbi:DNA-formamidopyrimidine glycosylase family protein [Parabacteroides bouchesdurhonensis]|uniref:DNA-formamidopyrimidine glycosylase family protein n=1 Tax=Parabacteroides bouchesdurhonensis TaxID=1936995 RepID=UPI000E4D13DD|nr:DNA-formamidopyrimidine glycosylase family protein [Parabacteroides bouchesdurhonensis]RHJ91047.1 endonuclease VIII [Bacteroides sp. AM07-16]